MKNINLILLRAFAVIFMINALMSCNSNKDLTTESVIMYTDAHGESYPVIAKPGQVIVCFNKSDKNGQLEIIENCGGDVIKHYPMLRTYLVSVEPGNEMELILKARKQSGVRAAYPDIISSPMSINMNLIDDFTVTDDDRYDADFSHGEYCYKSAVSADPENPQRITPRRYNTMGDFAESNILEFLNNIFYTTHPDSLILVNMSFGPPLIKVGKTEESGDEPTYVRVNDKSIRVPYPKTFENEFGNLEREWWKLGYIGYIQNIAQHCITIAENNPNFIIFKSSGNDYCHEMDDFIFSKLPDKLSPEELEMVKNHFLFVSAKDNDNEVPGELYASYANSPARYCPYMTMTDISHLKYDGTSFSTPLLLGHVARFFDIKGYKPLNSSSAMGYNVLEVVDHIKDSTREYATEIKQPGLFTGTVNANYLYGKRYTFKGILCSATEDLCETNNPETYHYIKINPIDIQPEYNDTPDEPLRNVTQLQIDNLPNLPTGEEITVSGELLYHIAGCHIHTDAYLTDCVIEGDSNESYDNNNTEPKAAENVYYFTRPNTILRGVLDSKITSYKDEYTGKITHKTYYFLRLKQPITVKNPNEDNPRLPQFPNLSSITQISLNGNFNPKEFKGLSIIVQGKLELLPINSNLKVVSMSVTQMHQD